MPDFNLDVSRKDDPGKTILVSLATSNALKTPPFDPYDPGNDQAYLDVLLPELDSLDDGDAYYYDKIPVPDGFGGGSQEAFAIVHTTAVGVNTDFSGVTRLDIVAISPILQAATNNEKLLKAQRFIDTTPTPWQVVLVEAGTGTLGVGTELLRQNLKDETGADVIDISTFIGQQTD
jgi:hypothetical protein